MGGACSQKLKSRRGLPSSSGRLLRRMGRRYFNPGPNRPAKTCSPGLQLVGEIHYCWGWVKSGGGSFLPSAQATVMLCSGRVGSFGIPPVHGQFGISTSNHEPVDGVCGNESTDFTSKFLQRCHAPRSVCQYLAILISCSRLTFPFAVVVLSGLNQISARSTHPN
jgi:hypothetical protein